MIKSTKCLSPQRYSKNAYALLCVCALGFLSCSKKTFSELHGIKKEMCACKTEACVKEVTAKIPLVKEPPDSQERQSELLALMSDMAKCAKIEDK